jgi:hypothetical protein
MNPTKENIENTQLGGGFVMMIWGYSLRLGNVTQGLYEGVIGWRKKDLHSCRFKSNSSL